MPKAKKPTKKQDAATVNNGLESAIFGSGFPGGYGQPGGQAASQAAPLFNNLRWYFVSNDRQALSQAYCELGLIQTVVDIPVDDGLRGGVDVTSKQLSPEQLSELSDALEKNDDLTKVGRALKWTRLFGGGGVMVMTDQDPLTPLDISAIGPDSPLEFRAVDMWELYFDLQNTVGYDAAIQDEKYDFYSYYGKKIHKSRVFKQVGIVAPSFIRPRLRGWGLSVVESLIRSMNQYLKGTNLIYELMDEAKIDVFGIMNLTNTLLASDGAARVAQRIQMANRQKNYQHALVMDKEDTYQQKTLTFSGLAEVMQQVRYQVASDLRMPVTKVFGISAAGFNSGEDDIEVYNAMIESTIRQPAKTDILKVIEIRCQKLFGFIPDDLHISFQPLRMMSGEQEQTVKEKKFNRLLSSLQAGAMSVVEFRDACNKDDLLEIHLENANLMEGADQVGVIPGDDVNSDEEAEASAEDEDVSEKAAPLTKTE